MLSGVHWTLSPALYASSWSPLPSAALLHPLGPTEPQTCFQAQHPPSLTLMAEKAGQGFQAGTVGWEGEETPLEESVPVL